MIYLIKSYLPLGKYIYKVGFTNNMVRRCYHYFYANPGFEIVSTREGDELLEKLLHYYLYHKGFQYKKNGKLDEWFLGNTEVRNIFHYSREKIEKELWKHREEIFNPGESSTDYKIFEYLYQKNKEGFIGNEFNYVDGKLTRTKAKNIDISFWSLIIKRESISSEYTNDIVFVFLKKFHYTGIFEEKMKMYCEFMDTFKDNIYIIDQIIHKVDPKFKTYYDLYGTSGCRAVRYEEIYLKRKIGDSLLEDSLKGRLIKEFKIGDRITLKDIKMRLQNIYTSLNITRTPKAKDLEQYFSVEELKLQDSLTKKRSKGYKIIGIL